MHGEAVFKREGIIKTRRGDERPILPKKKETLTKSRNAPASIFWMRKARSADFSEDRWTAFYRWIGDNIITFADIELLPRNPGSERDVGLLRSELFTADQLKRHAVMLAGRHKLAARPRPDRLLRRLDENERLLRDAYQVVTEALAPPPEIGSRSGQNVSPTEAWLLDNFYLIEQQVALVRRHLPHDYSKQLPQLEEGPSAGFPRIYDLALELISHQDGRLDHDNVNIFIAAYQSVGPLKLGELWAFPIMLRLALLENLRRIGVRIASRRREQLAAATWGERMLAIAETEPRKLVQVLAEFARAEIALTAPFIEEFYALLQAQVPAMGFVQTWVEHQLQQQGVTASQLQQAAMHSAAANQISIANSIGSLRFIGSMNWRDYVEALSFVERALRDDPAGVYAIQDFSTRDRYRHVVEAIASHADLTEQAVAQTAIRLASQAADLAGSLQDRVAHVGYYLVGNGRRLLEQAVACRTPWQWQFARTCERSQLVLYLGAIFLLAFILVSFVSGYLAGIGIVGWRFWVLVFLGLFDAFVLSVPVVNLLATVIVPPRILPRLDFSDGVPDVHRTMVVVPTLIDSFREIDNLLEALEIRYLGNRDPNLFFALLSDFRDAPEQNMPNDEALLAHARAAVEQLNLKYLHDRPSIFYLFHRPRTWNPYENLWMGFERKRGKLEQFNALLRGVDEGQTAFSDIVGETSILGTIKYVITLDTDTQLPRDAAQALVGNMAHPLNRPVYDAAKGRVAEGYAILQPRASASLASAGQSLFTRIFAGDVGIDPYTHEVSDVYQDIFAEGSFIGKGIYDVDAFRQAVGGRFPQNLVLSHDLLESAYARSALVADVDLIEDHPSSYAIETSRRHRWMRGDWQIAGWVLPRIPAPTGESGTLTRQSNPLSVLSRWKIFDNLRRSLVPPGLFALLVVGWLSGAGPAWVWTLLVAAILFIPPLLEAAIEFVRKPEESQWIPHALLTAKSLARPLQLAFLTLVFLPYEALVCLDAIAQSALRMPFTRAGLLLWYTPGYARRNACETTADYFREMWPAPALALVLGVVMAMLHATHWPANVPVLLLWLVSPAVGWWISQPLTAPAAGLTSEQRVFLRMLARKTWRYFAHFAGPDDNWLPPDNFQEYPHAAVASRTSPTNMGMALLANHAANDFGYIGAGEFLTRTENIFDAMGKLERYRGHFLNWYDTRTLQPLWPHYVSSVDSGNLIGCLLTLRAGLLELKDQPVIPPCVFQGLEDTLQVLMRQLPSPASEIEKKLGELQMALTSIGRSATPVDTRALLQQVQQNAHEITALLNEGGEPHEWAHALEQQAGSMLDELTLLMPEPQHFSRFPTLNELIKQETFAAEKLPPIALLPDSPAAAALERIHLIDNLAALCGEFAEMDFEFLYDGGCHLLSIGYDVGERRRDASCYDLLASEARLASFLLIAQGQLPQKHWFALGRALTSQGGGVSLISWSGSMFEYLMPQVIMPSHEDTLLYQTCRTAVARQIEYGRQRGIPWGISESCYNVADAQGVYQYRAFGVPGLGFKRGLADDLVIAPYATALALIAMPREACRNLQKLAEAGFLGAYGFYEAIDYTPSRVPPGMRHAVIRSFMAHHQGMSLLSFAHVLLDQPMQRRFLSDPYVRTAELLLQERIPKKSETISLSPHAAEVSAAARPASAEEGSTMRVIAEPNTPIPEVQLLSNGQYHVMTTAAGGSYSHWRGLAVTRWREDATLDNWGTFIYLRDRYSGRYWSTAYQPTLCRAERYEAIFLQARAEYRRRDEMIETHTELCVSPEDDVEIRRVKITNLSGHIRHIEVTSYAEVVLAPLNADLAHRAFSNLFVQTEIVPECQAILCTRRPRTPEEKMPWMFHLMAAPGTIAEDPTFETDRARFIGRGRTPANPVVLDSVSDKGRLSNTTGPVLDPIVAVRRIVTLAPDESATVLVISGVSETREGVLALIAKYADHSFADRAFDMAWFRSQEVLRHLNSSEYDAQVYDRLAASVIHANHLRRAPAAVLARNRLGQAGLWRFAVSGDLPIVLVRIANQDRIDLVRQAVQAHAYWRMKGLASDLVILNEDFSGYRAVLHDLIVGIVNTSADAPLIDKPGGVFVRRAEELSEEERVLFQTVARAVITDSAETLAEQVERRVPRERLPERRKGWRLGSQQRRALAEQTAESLVPVRQPIADKARPLQVGERLFFNGIGGFSADGREYVITLEPGQNTPAPWVNVIASPYIGTVVSECGGAYTWVGNAHEFRLTPFNNDPVGDISGEALYIRDEETGQYWSPAPLPVRGSTGYACRHGFGYSIFEHFEAGIFSQLSVYVAMDAPVKLAVVKLRNHSGQPRRLSLTGYWELVMGEWRHANLMHIVTETDPQTGALFAYNNYGRECAHRVVFAQVSEVERSVSGSRADFIGRNGSLAKPLAMSRMRLSGKTSAGLDPCAALQCYLDLEDGSEHEVVFAFGAARDVEEAQQLIRRYGGPAGAWQAWDAMYGHWRAMLGAVQVETPDAALNLLANGWLLYQTISCRLWARSGYYQSGGAYGFRDQLQDTLALVHAAPQLTREHLLRCAEHQFVQGDVQHWWHPPGVHGVRTHFSDDYLWLPYALCRYVIATGDHQILDESVHFIEGRELAAEEEAYYDQPLRSTEVAPLYEHCVRAIKHGLRFGAHGLPLIGCGDWNDGMNLVGREGKGESVWLAWFLYENLNLFADLAKSRGDTVFAKRCMAEAAKLRTNIEAHAWDGNWYRRAYFDDGTPLGSASNDECQIDSISQSWAVISGGGDPARAQQALSALDERLVRRDAGLIQLLTPPFDKSSLEPGYIKGYVPGVRENGGQYTHAAIWATMAFAMRGEREKAWELFTMLNPIHHGSDPDAMARYRVEPYVMCADIYGAPPHTGRGGWTWYTGAAGWMARLVLETLLGLRLEADRLHLSPCLPPSWTSYSLFYRYRETPYIINIRCGKNAAKIIGIRMDGNTEGETTAITLIDDKREHHVDIDLD